MREESQIDKKLDSGLHLPACAHVQAGENDGKDVEKAK